ncbi:Pathogenicity locus [Deefgea rivuli]|uniref:Pathogenicity locus n=1 Tax=Deefgea rivuli TaxID=400948 RepID=UPI0004871C74|nr:Pathogenicity locus [Deefgea rivuli]
MPFSAEEHALLLAIKGVGSTVITRLEQLGFSSLTQLSQANALEIVEMASDMLGSTCWKNSPQARAAIQSAITLAQSRQA